MIGFGHRTSAPRVVVTGASGFLGNAVIRELIAQDVCIVPVARRPHPGSVLVEDYANTPSGDVLVHLAENRDRTSTHTTGEDHELYAASTLQSLLAKGWQRVVYASSAVLYGDNYDTLRTPTDPVYVTDAYTRIKQAGENAVLATEAGVVARLANLYGKGMASNNVLSTILAQIPGNEPIMVWDDMPVRDFLWVEDAAKAIANMVVMTPAGNPGIYNVGTGVGTSVGELARLALDIAGCGERPVVATKPAGRPSCITLDITKTMMEWNWRPQVFIRQGVAALLADKRLEMNRTHE